MGTCSSKTSAAGSTKPYEGVVEHTQPLKQSNSSDGSGDNKTTTTNASTPGRSPKVNDKQRMALRGYSSGGSSEYSDGDINDINVSAHGHLIDWKQELQSNSGPGRARIEVSFVSFGNEVRSKCLKEISRFVIFEL